MPPSLLRAAGPDAARAAYEQANHLAAVGELAAAEAAYRRALSARPAFAEAWNNLGNVMMPTRRFTEAAECYAAALAHGLDHPLVHYNLATARRRLGNLAAAAAGFKRALVMQPDYAEAWNNLANLWREEKRLSAACVGYLRALRLKPDWEEAHDNLSAALYLLAEAGEAPSARGLAQQWRAAHPDHPLARHLGAALAGETGDPRAADAYVRQVFDVFADDFEERLTELQYRAPELLAAALVQAGIGRDGAGLDILDAGCGTGWCGPYLRKWARRLEGVDLSPGMLAQAEARGLYDGLTAAELTAFLQERPGAFDLIVAADVLCYFGRLDEVFAASFAGLRPGGTLAFSVERWAEPEAGRTYLLQAHGRYAHGEDGVRTALAVAGFADAVLETAILRTESGRPVIGLAVVARRP